MNAPLPYVNLSRYDGNNDTNHVHVPASTSAPDGGSTWSGHQRSRSKHEGYDNLLGEKARKDNHRISVSLPGSRENLRSISSSDLQAGVRTNDLQPNGRTRNNSFCYEPIYANQKESTPPPELPPKGPHLRQIRPNRPPFDPMTSWPPAPPRPPNRRPPKPRTQPPQFPPRYVSHNSSQQEDYFMMGSFDKEPTHCRLDYNEPCRMVDPLTGRQVVSLPPKEKKYTVSEIGDCYMDMSGIIELEKSRNSGSGSSSIRDVSVCSSQRPKYGRSFSASGADDEEYVDTYAPLCPQRPDVSVSAGNSPAQQRRVDGLIREENYILMSEVKVSKKTSQPQSVGWDSAGVADTDDVYVNTSILDRCVNGSGRDLDVAFVEEEESFNDHDEDQTQGVGEVCAMSRPEETDKVLSSVLVPFDDLLDFSLPFEHPPPPPPGVTDKTDTVSIKSEASSHKSEHGNSGKTPSFFSRLMRRNSKDRKSVSQSQENLLITCHSEPTIKEDIVDCGGYISVSSASSDSSRSQSQQDLVHGPHDRSRSSSFPNRSSFIAMSSNAESASSSSTGISVLSQHSGATNSSFNSCGTISTHTSSNEGNLNAQDSVDEEHLGVTDNVKGGYDDQSYFMMGPFEPSRKRNEGCDHLSLVRKRDTDFEKSEENTGKVFTVLNVQSEINESTCKTDDEKLIELWHSTHSLSEKADKISDLKSKMKLPLEELSPDEKASAIAKHISTLPPFVPPKMKSYPTKLSPVLERHTPKGEKPDCLDITGKHRLSLTDKNYY